MTRDRWKENPAGPKYIVGVTGFVYRPALPKLTSRAAMYRCLLQNLRLIPDPVIWSMVVPAMRKWCTAPKTAQEVETAVRTRFNGAEGSEDMAKLEVKLKAELKELEGSRKRTLDNAKEILADVRAAVGVHPHALLRLVRDAYGVKSQRRHSRMRRVIATSKASDLIRKHEEHLGPGRPQIPACIEPLFKGHSLIGAGRSQSGDNAEEDETSARKARALWQKEFESINVPLIMPTGTGIQTGVEGTGIVETLQTFANVWDAYTQVQPVYDVDVDELQAGDPITEYHTQYPFPRVNHLASFRNLSPVIQKIFPIKLKPTRREPPFPRPPRHETKLNPKTWRHPVLLTPRVFTRAYGQIWNELEWTRPKGRDPAGPWVQCSYEELLLWGQGRWDELGEAAATKSSGFTVATQEKVSKASAQDNHWLRYKKGRKQTKSAIDRMLKPKQGQSSRA